MSDGRPITPDQVRKIAIGVVGVERVGSVEARREDAANGSGTLERTGKIEAVQVGVGDE